MGGARLAQQRAAMEEGGSVREDMEKGNCPCKKRKCPRHGNCAACREHHAQTGRCVACEREPRGLKRLMRKRER